MKKVISVLIIIVVVLSGCNEDSKAPTVKSMEIVEDSSTVRTISFEQLATSLSIISVVESEFDSITYEEDYFTKQNTYVYIRITLLNLDNFEIEKLTINNEEFKASDFMDGSDNEVITIRTTSGDMPGIKEFILRSVSYLDDGESKLISFLLDGEVSITMGVEYEEEPTVELKNIITSQNTVAFDVTVIDEEDVLGNPLFSMKVFVLQGNTIIDSMELKTKEQRYSYYGLTDDTSYTYAIILAYDKLDGNGGDLYVLEYDDFVNHKEFPALD